MIVTDIDNDLARLIHRVYTEKKQITARESRQALRLNGYVPEYLSNNKPSEFFSNSALNYDFGKDRKSSNRSQIKTGGLTISDKKYDIEFDYMVKIKASNERPESYDSMAIDMKKGYINTSMQNPRDNVENLDDNQIQIIRVRENENEQSMEKDEHINKMTSAIMEACRHRKGGEQHDPLAFCWLWDFAGEKDYYATHQVFLSTCAVYLLVTDSLEFSTAKMLWTDIEDSAGKFYNRHFLICL